MNKIFFFFCLSFLCFSCSKKNENSSRPSTGKINAISVVIDDQMWNGIIGDSIRNKFASPVEGLTKEEPQFDLNQFPIDVMEGFVTKSRTIIIVKKGSENHFEIKKNRFATPQTVIQVTGETLSDILDIFEKRTPEMIKIIKKGEIIAHQRLLNDSLLNSTAISKQFQLELKIPKSYTVVVKKDKFVWLKNEFPYGSTNLLITQLPLTSINSKDKVLDKVINVHDSITALYIKSKEPSSCLYIDQTYPLYQSQITLDDKSTYETKGIWRLKNSFMFGSFINYLILDPKNNRIVCLEGFCYIPSRERRDYMHELEAIIKGVKIN